MTFEDSVFTHGINFNFRFTQARLTQPLISWCSLHARQDGNLPSLLKREGVSSVSVAKIACLIILLFHFGRKAAIHFSAFAYYFWIVRTFIGPLPKGVTYRSHPSTQAAVPLIVLDINID
jgi:hypothetical protein